ncbi:flagellar basal body P-ring formation chaperone FlgA [Pseudoalteromonas sp. SSMSWG5]|jgi:flagella basal body P-ring formation protein FlgA|uniref:flagellar basal body P-ring formation chaperone FlgA n=1 Tax=Pseudoalteromonas TaxID=53246 RepID=UPI000C3798DE|nr:MULTISPECIES: flagellar basal body P-ring formation chaperone FlgA [unclassified Pseudoalteromonas]MBD58489.1 flagella basal body P-ring formation protein FlgA [Pseudoalteromonas sp.]MBU76465.1 flagella basal body P-ring formation protein FlgA [Pseudoalteromonadaceae bacterium]MCF2900393.1 flagellar basal body P-ring formation protein FlgA [Pseudoalteromonas sp. OFAV1]MCF2919013.1 flagellar basal body P-ring formation protein FlgA [Pseudoalteromonas sp. APAL1]MCO7248581.1 flagellar basal bo|tara:strand:- start:928 stop:1632 length:705 start_codon:yes stop_codon:yes gene_type:complete
MSLLKKSRRYSVFYFLASLLSITQVHAEVYKNEQLQQIAIDFVSEQLTDLESTPQVSALPLDSRIPDRVCESPLSKEVPTTPPFNRQVTVQLKCEDINSWTQYVHVRIIELEPVVVVTTHLSRGEVIRAEHLRLEMKPKQFVRTQYVQDESILIGSRIKRNLRDGTPIVMSQVCMVCKGDNVTIYASLRGLRIKTTGIALEDGTLDELVRVKNKKSGKVLNARVDGVESVQVNI